MRFHKFIGGLSHNHRLRRADDRFIRAALEDRGFIAEAIRHDEPLDQAIDRLARTLGVFVVGNS